ncbi:MAG: YqaJ viral recombinase family protein [Burkholderiales bacterium]
MSTIVKLVQGTPEWHEHRRKHRNASETPAVLGVSPWQTAYQLWTIKTGRAPQPEVTAAMAHGTKLEPIAREAYELQTGHLMEPLVLVDGDYSASLDGMTLDGRLILEIKCPKSRDSKLMAEAKAGRVPVYVYWQIQTQLFVSHAELAHLFVYDGTGGILLEQRPEAAAWDTICQDWDQFMRHVRDDQAPPLTERDTLLRSDEAWVSAAQEYLASKRHADEAAAALDVSKLRLMSLAKHTSEQGGGVAVTRYWKSGVIDYKKIPELTDVDLDRYRALGRDETRITVLK